MVYLDQKLEPPKNLWETMSIVHVVSISVVVATSRVLAPLHLIVVPSRMLHSMLAPSLGTRDCVVVYLDLDPILPGSVSCETKWSASGGVVSMWHLALVGPGVAVCFACL